MATEGTTATIQQLAAAYEPYIIEQRRHFHKHPELSLQEFQTTEDIAREAMRLAGHKLPIKTKFMVKGQVNPVTGEMPEGGEKITEGGEG